MTAGLSLTNSKPLIVYEEPVYKAKQRAQIPPNTHLRIVDGTTEWVLIETEKKKRGWLPIGSLHGLSKALEYLQLSSDISLIDLRALNFLVQRVEGLWTNRSGLNEVYNLLQKLIDLVQPLAYLARSGHAFLKGDPNSEEWLATIFEATLLTKTFFRSGPTSSAVERITIAGFELPYPSLPGYPVTTCLFLPFDYSRLILTLQQFQERFKSNKELAKTSLFEQLRPNFIALETLDALYAMTRNGINREAFEQAFWTLTAISSSGDLPQTPPLPNAELPIPFPLPGGFVPFDPCRFERGEGTKRLTQCFCNEQYRIQRIVNIDRTSLNDEYYEGIACTGDIIEIQGEGFRDTRDWGIGGRYQSEVVFSGIGTRGIVATDYLEWSDTRIRVRVPAGTRNGLVNLRIICDRVNISECEGIILRPPMPGSAPNRRLTLPPPPMIEQFNSSAYHWCYEFSCLVRVLNAEVVRITKEDGTLVPFPEGDPGPLRDVEGRITLVEKETTHYILEAENACHSTNTTATIERYPTYHLKYTGNVRAGGTVELDFDHYCSPRDLGVEEIQFNISIEDQDNVLIDPPGKITLTGNSNTVHIGIETRRGTCGIVRMTALPANPGSYPYRWETASTGVIVYDRPHLLEAQAIGANLCDSFVMKIIANCVGYRADELRAYLVDMDTGDTIGTRLHITDVDYVASSPHQGVHLTLQVPANRRIGIRRIGVFVEQFGLSSNTLLVSGISFRIPNPQICSFTPSRDTIYSGGPREPVALEFEVKYTRQVEIWASGGRLGRGDSVIYTDTFSDQCASWRETVNDTIEFPLTYELRAYGFNGHTISDSITIQDSRPPMPPTVIRGIASIVIFNCDQAKRDIVVWTQKRVGGIWQPWQQEGRVAHGVDTREHCPRSDAPRVAVTFDDGELYQLCIVMPDRPTCDGRNEPGLANCQAVAPSVILGDDDGFAHVYYYNEGNFPQW